MAHKRTLAKKSGQGMKHGGSETAELKSLVEGVQKALRAGDFDGAYSGACRLDGMLRDKMNKPQLRDIRLTSLVWKVRAKQGAKAPDEEVLALVRNYYDESMAAGDAARVGQAMKIETQMAVDAGDWEKAEDILTKYAEIQQKTKQMASCAEALGDVAGMQIRQCHFNDALETLNQAMDAAESLAGGEIADNLKMKILQQYHDIYELSGDDGSAVHVLDALMALTKADHAHASDTAHNSILIYRRMLRRNQFRRAAEVLASVAKMVEKDSKCVPSVRAARMNIVMLEQAQLNWQCGAYHQARTLDRMIGMQPCPPPMARAAAMTRYQWAIETGKPGDDPDRAASEAHALIGKDADIPLKLAAQLADAELMLERGRYDEADEILHHVEETAQFLMLAPIMTRAKAMRITVCKSRDKYVEAVALSEDVFRAFSGFGNVVDIYASFMVCLNLHLQHPGVMWLAAAQDEVREAFMTARDGFYADAQDVLKNAFDEGNVDGALSIGIQMLHCHLLREDTAAFDALEAKLAPLIHAEDMAHRAMTFMRLCAMRFDGTTEGAEAEREARRIADVNGFHWRRSI